MRERDKVVAEYYDKCVYLWFMYSDKEREQARAAYTAWVREQDAQVEQLRELVKSAFMEGWVKGNAWPSDAGIAIGLNSYEDWKSSRSKVALENET